MFSYFGPFYIFGRASIKFQAEVYNRCCQGIRAKCSSPKSCHAPLSCSSISCTNVQVHKKKTDLLLTFSLGIGEIVVHGCFSIFYSEPVSSSKPKFAGVSVKTLEVTVSREKPGTLLCPAQGFPVPAFRY